MSGETLREAVERLAEEATQRAYMQAAIEKGLTVQLAEGDPSRAVVPDHWRESAEFAAIVSVNDIRDLLAEHRDDFHTRIRRAEALADEWIAEGYADEAPDTVRAIRAALRGDA